MCIVHTLPDTHHTLTVVPHSRYRTTNMKLIPTKTQWNKWALPTKASYPGVNS